VLIGVIFATMNMTQCKMGRAALGWSAAELAAAAGIGARTVARFELGESVQADSIQKMRAALEAAGIQFLDRGSASGALIAPAR
jgi:transcriptional regulator with XRE-family HTH domain